MSKYEPLRNYLENLAATNQFQVTLSFEELEGILGFSLCDSAHEHQPWWGNDRTHPQARAWLDAGWQCVDKDLVNMTATFGVLSGLSKAQKAEPHSSYLRASEQKGVIGHTSFEKPKSPILVFSPCSKNKCEKPAEYIPNFTPVEPWRYLEDKELLKRLMDTRKCIVDDLEKRTATQGVLAFDLYVRTGKAYKEIFHSYYKELRDKLIQNDDIQWFFISGGYGVIHALEKAVDYQATFSKQEADENNIPFTGDIWREAGLSAICEHIVQNLNPSRVYVFGGRDYIRFIKSVTYLKGKERVKIMPLRPGCRSSSLSWPIRNLAKAIFHGKLDEFDRTYQSQFKPL